MNKSIIFLTIAIVVAGLLFLVISFERFEPTTVYSGSDENTTSAPHESVNTPANTNTSTSQNDNNSSQTNQNTLVTSSQLGMHNTKQDCWVGYNGKAYDLTSWLLKHPGGVNTIAQYCGTSEEFQQAFKRQHGTSQASRFMKVAMYKGDLG